MSKRMGIVYGIFGVVHFANTLSYIKDYRVKLSKSKTLHNFLVLPTAAVCGATWPISLPLQMYFEKNNKN